jgi:hypothetical protein
VRQRREDDARLRGVLLLDRLLLRRLVVCGSSG